MDFVPKEKATPIREPSTANLMIDSSDRDFERNPNAATVNIQRNNSILNGFFTRVSASEIVLDWFQPNVAANFGNDSLDVEYSVNAGPVVNTTLTFFDGFYTQAQLLDALALELNDDPGAIGGYQWQIVAPQTGVNQSTEAALVPTDAAETYPISVTFSGPLALQLFGSTPFTKNFPAVNSLLFIAPRDLRPYTYIDFVCNQLTANQSVKDASTAPIVRDVLARWYFAYDNPPALDKYGYPILMGYTSFCLRRLYSPPKQIKWESNIPIGNLEFNLYDEFGDLITIYNATTNWQMTLLVSEV
jgi:hypothetical protein